MSAVHARVARLQTGLDRRRREPRQPLRRHPAVRWLRRPLLGGPPEQRRGAPSPFKQGLADGRREGYELGHADGYQQGYARGYGDGLQAGAAAAGED